MSGLEDALAVPGALLLLACIAARFIAPFVREKVRPAVLKSVTCQLDFVSRLQQRLRNPFLDVLARITAHSVSVEFYLLFIPPVAWMGGLRGTAGTMAVCQCMAVSTYMTCVLKDMLCCPRPGPASTAARIAKEKAAGLAAAGKAEELPPRRGGGGGGVGVTAGVEVLESAYRGEVEMGAPSMHTWCALVMPAYSTAVAMQLGAISPQLATALTAVSVVWAVWVALSRLYLGVHTPIDLTLGGTCGAAMLGLWRRVGLVQIAAIGQPAITGAAAAVWERFPFPEWAQVTEGSLGALLGVGAVYVLALATYPRPLSHTTSYEYAVIFLGAAYGGLVSLSGRCSLAPALLQHLVGAEQAGSPGAPFAVVAALPPLLRHPAVVVLLGFASVAVVKAASKATLSLILPPLMGLAPTVVRRLWQPPVHPAGCWRPEPPVSAVATITTEATATEIESKLPTLDRKGGDAGRSGGCGLSHGAGGAEVVLMKSPRLAYDVDFLRKFINYGITVYAAMEFRHVAAVLALDFLV